MKFRIDRDALADAVAWTARSLPVRPPSVPVLAGLMVESTDGGIALSGFDYETSARTTVDADVADEGRVLVSGRLLADICKSLPSRPVDVVLDGPKVSVTCGSARFSLQTMPVADYPALPAVPNAAGTVSADEFATAVGQAVAAAGRDDVLALLTGVRIEFEGSTIALLATDRFRASLRELPWFPNDPALSTSAVVPAKALSDIAKSFTAGGDLTIAVSGQDDGQSLIGFEGSTAAGTRRTTTRLLEGEFPKVRQLFSAASETVAYVGTADLVDAVRRVSLVAERNTPVRMTFSEGQVLLEAGSGDDAQAQETLEATVEGEGLAIGFNPTFLLEGLQVLGKPMVHMSFTQPSRPASLAGVQEAGEQPGSTFRYLIMPVRLPS
ncbi:DNA polymerase-3 subunit beta [Mumia flava]|uniref:Beta sliding clamp n=1 Tax=Mumia flava TaxID=1348852 RepID=A0A0B2B6G8_9ACTN|nr:DNA polymerase III subunit beta [Mumia flava]PJJ57647.1 DNA polymerase-3 subunit beta [Mumia flava]